MCFLFTTPGLTVHICIDRQVTEESGQQVFKLHLLTCFTLNQSNYFISTYQPNNLWDVFCRASTLNSILKEVSLLRLCVTHDDTHLQSLSQNFLVYVLCFSYLPCLRKSQHCFKSEISDVIVLPQTWGLFAFS